MNKSMFICILALLFGNAGMAQLEGSHWFFGDSVILKFTEDSIYVTQAQLSSEEATSTISDKEGNLLFYTNSGFIYNKFHEPIHDEPFFAYIYDPANPGNGNGVPDACLLLPDPKNPDTLFYMLNFGNGLLDYYGIDSRKNFGLGGLIDSAVDIDLGDSIISVDTKLTAVRHGNGRDWWIFLRTSWTTAPNIQFIRWLLTPEGFSGPQYIPLPDWVEEEHWYFGNMFFSQSGERLVVIERTGFEVYDFDRCTGELEQIAVIEDLYNLVDNAQFFYGALSGSGEKLYIGYTNPPGGWSENYPSGIYQYDLSLLPDAEAVNLNGTLIFEENVEHFGISALKYEQLSDNIYFIITNVHDSVYSYNLFLQAILEPELTGMDCIVQLNYIQLGIEEFIMGAQQGLPNMPNYALGAFQGSPCDTLDTANAVIEALPPSFQIYPNPVSKQLYINNPFNTNYQTVVYNLQGQVIYNSNLQPGSNFVDTTNWPDGCYSLHITTENQTTFRTTLIKSK